MSMDLLHFLSSLSVSPAVFSSLNVAMTNSSALCIVVTPFKNQQRPRLLRGRFIIRLSRVITVAGVRFTFYQSKAYRLIKKLEVGCRALSDKEPFSPTRKIVR